MGRCWLEVRSLLYHQVSVIKEGGWSDAVDFEVSGITCNLSGRFKASSFQQHPGGLGSHRTAAMAPSCSIKAPADTTAAVTPDGLSGTDGICNQLSLESQVSQFTAETHGADSNLDAGHLTTCA